MQIDTSPASQTSAQDTAAPKRIYKRIPHDRMGGTIPVWENIPAPSPQNTKTPINTSALSDQNNPATAPPTVNETEEFGFDDLLDMLNPLHHIPLVGPLYRAVTGDTITTPAKIVGAAAYGGPLGFASALGNAVIEQETGQDLISLALNRRTQPRSPPPAVINTPETALSLAQNANQDPDAARTLLSFADLSHTQNPTLTIEKQPPAPAKYAHQNNARYND